MIRIVLDTNVFISSFFGGNPKEIIDLWKSGKVILCVTPSIIGEYMEVLHRLGLKDEPELKELLEFFSKSFHMIFTSNTPKLEVVAKDPEDNKFFECAVALKGKYIVSGDKAVQEIREYFGIKVLNPKDFLDEMKNHL
ncbi:putative toxin-antitoxin system toxin component, PIN family [Deltaproteobacteria bacterium TL4]